MPPSVAEIAMPFLQGHQILNFTWWRHQMETFSTLLALSDGNPPGTGDAELWWLIFGLRLNKRLSTKPLSVPMLDLFIRPVETNYSEIWITVQQFSNQTINFKVSSAKWPAFCLGLNVLNYALGIKARSWWQNDNRMGLLLEKQVASMSPWSRLIHSRHYEIYVNIGLGDNKKPPLLLS